MPGESRGQRSLANYSPTGLKESDMTECARTHTHTHTHIAITRERDIGSVHVLISYIRHLLLGGRGHTII